MFDGIRYTPSEEPVVPEVQKLTQRDGPKTPSIAGSKS